MQKKKKSCRFNMDFNSLIGLEESKARLVLAENGFDDIETTINSKHNEQCDTLIVCAVKENDGQVLLICGEFYLEIKG